MYMLSNKTLTVNKHYYDKSNCRFVLCESCWWFATILKDASNISSNVLSVRKEEKLYIERILGMSNNINNRNLIK